MNEKLAALHCTHTWDHVPLLSGANPMSCKLIYKIKTKSDSFVEGYKARRVACEFTLEYGIDY